MKRVNPNHDPKHRSRRWDYKSIKKQPHKDNDVRRYDDIKQKIYGKWVEKESLENVIRKAIQKERDEWRTPYWIVEAEDYRYD